MTLFDRFENRLPALLDELASPRLPDYADDLFARTAATRQRPGWTFPERWLFMSSIAQRLAAAPNIPWRLGALVALLVVAALFGLLIAGTQQRNLPAPFGPAANGVIPYVDGGDIYVGDLANGTSRLLVGGPQEDVGPQFSLDGTRMAFYRIDPGTASVQVYAVRSDGSDLKRITPEAMPGGDLRSIAWTPDGGHIAVVHSVNGVNQLDLFDASGSGSVERIAAAAGLDSLQFRPPDGGEMLFRACVDVATSCGLYVLDTDGTNVEPRLLVPPATTGDTLDLTGAVYSADGSRIYFNRWTVDANVGTQGCCQLFVVNADGTNFHEFIPNTGGAWDGQAVVSPDGSRVAFWHNDKPTHGISVIRTDGTGGIIETGPKLDGTAHWVWAPDSSKILMTPSDAVRTSAYLLDPEGGPYTTVPWQSDTDLDWQRIAP